MSKRAAESQISKDSVSDDDSGGEEEEAGRFNVASSEQLQQRLIKTAHRRTSADSGTEKPTTGIFSGIKLLTGQALPPPPPKFAVTTEPASSKTSNTRYLEQLSALNTSVCAWITKHVAENPFVDLGPVFRDYEKHLAGIETGGLVADPPPAETGKEGGGKGERPMEDKPVALAEKKPAETKLEFKAGPKLEFKMEPKLEFKVESKFPGMAAVKEADEDGDDDGEAEEPPLEEKPKRKSAADEEMEKNALMTTRAKLFYKKEDEYKELGTGNLLVCKTTGSGVQLFMRNETTLGKVLLNVRVTGQVPLNVKGNNVFVVCAPNPPLSSKPAESATPATYLIRVKTADIATNLHSTIKQSSQ